MAKLLSGKFNPITNVSCIHYAINLSPFIVSDKVALRTAIWLWGLYSHIATALSAENNCSSHCITDARTDDNTAYGYLLCKKACD